MGKNLLVSFLVLFLMLGFSFAAAATPSAGDFHKANKLFASAQYKDALSLYQKTLSAPPASVPVCDIHTRIGDTHFRLGNFKNALEAYRSAIKGQKPSDRPQTQYWIGFCCFLLWRDAEAVAEFLKVPELYPEASMWISTSYYWAGRASERMGRKELAAEYYRKAGGNGKSTQGRFAMKKAEAAKKTSAKLQAQNPN